ncbi:MAG: acyl-protein synthetase [Firmicutes bacterium]|nr:acyl-protein synthetase [Bacillota bacterium]
MEARKKLFRYRKPYDVKATDDLFVTAMRKNAAFQYEHCPDYKRILDEQHFNPYEIKSMSDLADLPFIPTLYFKHHKLYSMPDRKMLIKVTSSGTSGMKSQVGFDIKSLLRGLSMVITVGKYHKLWSLRPTNYIIFGYEPNKNNHTAISKTAFGSTFFAPASSRTYALRNTKDGYKLDMEAMKQALIRHARKKQPIRTVGFPAYTYFLLKQLKEEGIKLHFPKGSKVTLGGGWKQFYAQKVDKEDFYALVEEVLGIPSKDCIEFFGAVEHPILYTDCRYHHFHIPVYGRVIIRDPDTMKPVSNGQIGIVNLLTPMVNSVPLLSVMTDDLGILHDEKCPCGVDSPYLEIIGRVGIQDIVTCAAGAEDLLKNS